MVRGGRSRARGHPSWALVPQGPRSSRRAKPSKVTLSDGVLLPGSFAAGLLGASRLTGLHARRARHPGESVLLPHLGRALEAAARAGLQPSLDLIGPKAEAAIRAWAKGIDKDGMPEIIAAWETEVATTFLLSGFVFHSGLPSHSVKDSLGQRTAFEPYGEWGEVDVPGDVRRVRAVVTGPPLPRLRPTISALTDGLLVPVGFTDSGVLHLPLLGPATSFTGDNAVELLKAVLLYATTRLGQENCTALVPEHLRLFAETIANVDAFASGVTDEVVSELEVEKIRRARLIYERGADDIRAMALSHPHDSLPVRIIVLDSDTEELVRFVSSSGPFSGISVLVLGDFAQSRRRITTDAGEGVVELGDGLEEFIVEPALLPPDVVAEAALVLRGATGDLSFTPKNPAAMELMRGSRITSLFPDAAEEVSASTAELMGPAVTEEHRPGIKDVSAVASRRVLCLGQMRVELNGEVVEGWRQKSLQLLALLAVNPKGVSKDAILETLWPGKDPVKSGATLRQVRKAIRDQLGGSAETDPIVLDIDQRLRLDWTAVEADVPDFLASAAAADRTDRPETQLRKAVSLYLGDFCQDADYVWAEEIREQLRATFVDAAARLAEILTGKGETDMAIELLDRAIVTDPFAEDLYRRAMELESKRGRRDAIVQRYRKLEKLLSDDLAVKPQDETRELFDSLTGQD